MTNWSDPAEIAKELQAAKLMVMICLGYAFCDLCYTYKFDWDIIRGKRGARRWPQALYLLAKIGYWPYIAVTFAVAEPPAFLQCNALVYASEALMGLITCCCSGLLAFRAVAVWNDRAFKFVAPVTLVLFLALSAIWMAGVPDVKATWIEGPGPVWIKNQGTCTFLPIPERYGYKFIAAVAFDFIVLMLTVAGVASMNSRSRIGRILIEQGVIYFIATLVMNIFLVSFTFSDLNPLMSNILNVPTQTVQLVASTRLYVMLCDKVRPGHVSNDNSNTYYTSSNHKTGDASPSSSTVSKLRNALRLNKNSAPESNSRLPETYGMQSSHGEGNLVHLSVDANSESNEKLDHLTHSHDDDLESGRSAHPYAQTQVTGGITERPRSMKVQVSQQTTVASEPMPAYLKGMDDLRK
ncbi:hypothetical protein ACQY0O_000489 [Thecaphora frezii]